MRYPYYQVTSHKPEAELENTYRWYRYTKSLGHTCWIEQTQNSKGTVYAVWRMGEGLGTGINEDPCEGVIIEASHPYVEERVGKGGG